MAVAALVPVADDVVARYLARVAIFVAHREVFVESRLPDGQGSYIEWQHNRKCVISNMEDN